MWVAFSCCVFVGMKAVQQIAKSAPWTAPTPASQINVQAPQQAPIWMPLTSKCAVMRQYGWPRVAIPLKSGKRVASAIFHRSTTRTRLCHHPCPSKWRNAVVTVPLEQMTESVKCGTPHCSFILATELLLHTEGGNTAKKNTHGRRPV
jgi:hypothetical protein